MTPAQRNFLALHIHGVIRWQWHFLDTQLRAYGLRSTATIWRDELDDLVSRGLLRWSHGVSVEATALGRSTMAEVAA